MQRFILLLATGFGFGYAPAAPGTAGTAAALVISFLLHRIVPPFPFWVPAVVTALLFTAGVTICGRAEQAYGKDASRIVYDEMVGTWITLLWVPFCPETAVAAFALFRFFDIVKPYPIQKAEAVPGGLGVMLDDAVAGIIANIILHGYAAVRGL